jgi:UDP-glucuronate 4-epimerase
MKTESQRVLLTGGAGFIGSHVAEALLKRGTSLGIVDNLDNFYSPAWKKANLEATRRVGAYEFFNLDICEIDSLSKIIKQYKPSAVIHLAARAGVRPSIEQPLLYEHVNVRGTLNLLEVSREFGIRRFVFGSSSSVYGATSRAPFSEDQVELRPLSPYAATKLSGELLAYTYAHLFQLEVVSLRFFTVYGPRQRPDLAIHKFIALIEEGKALPIFGDGEAGRDYTYVDDIVSGVVSGLDYEFPAETKTRFENFNLGNSHPVKLTELIDEIERATSRSALREQKPPQPGDVPLTWADIRKAERLLGYRPATPLRQGLRRFVEWYRSTDPSLRA